MSDRYFVDEPISADRVTLSGPEAHHLIHVMRAAPGTRVTLFDGSGDRVYRRRRADRTQRRGVVDPLARADRPGTAVRLDAWRGAAQGRPAEVARREGGRVGRHAHRAAADATGGRPAGRTSARPAAAHGHRGVETVRPQPAAADRRAARRGPSSCAGAAGAACRLLAHPGGEPVEHDEASALPAQPSCQEEPRPPRTVFLAIGPEGGFAEEEVALAPQRAGCAVDLARASFGSKPPRSCWRRWWFGSVNDLSEGVASSTR